jgi:hypothetical protein
MNEFLWFFRRRMPEELDWTSGTNVNARSGASIQIEEKKDYRTGA